MILGYKTCYEHILKINLIVLSPTDVTLLGVKIHNSLTFKKHIDNLVRNVQYELHAVRHFTKFLTIETAKIQSNGFIDSKFNYVALM